MPRDTSASFEKMCGLMADMLAEMRAAREEERAARQAECEWHRDVVDRLVAMQTSLIGSLARGGGAVNTLSSVDSDSIEKEKCRRSVVVSGLAEADGPADRRNGADQAAVREMLVELDVDSVPKNIYRMGVFDPARKKRLLKVEFSNMHDAIQVLRQSSRLTSSKKFSSIRVRNSHTHQMRVKLREAQDADPAKIYVIYGDNVVCRGRKKEQLSGDDETFADAPGMAPSSAEGGVGILPLLGPGSAPRHSQRPPALTPAYAEYKASHVRTSVGSTQ